VKPRGPDFLPGAEVRLVDIAQELGVTHQAVAQIERRALDKARKLLEEKGVTLRDFLDAMEMGRC
jgi:DNA-directed RNA polymerase sigma subunit (sigma70/sigma32)